ncbi:MAG: bacillithiol biosynthesis deacetylase BshB1 [Salibacteraceae bacterium]
MKNTPFEVDILAIGAHPDDVELGCSGTLIKAVAQGQRVGICDLTRGELGTRGNADLRLQEAEAAGNVIGADFRINLGMPDGFFQNNPDSQLQIIRVIRACRPKVVLCNAPEDRHPDHGRGAALAATACFLSGLRKIETEWGGSAQPAYRPEVVLHYVQDHFLQPHVVIDITPFWDQKMKAILSFESQFYNPNSNEPDSPISSKEFLETVRGRALQMGRYIRATYGEGFVSSRPLGVTLPTLLR